MVSLAKSKKNTHSTSTNTTVHFACQLLFRLLLLLLSDDPGPTWRLRLALLPLLELRVLLRLHLAALQELLLPLEGVHLHLLLRLRQRRRGGVRPTHVPDGHAPRLHHPHRAGPTRAVDVPEGEPVRVRLSLGLGLGAAQLARPCGLGRASNLHAALYPARVRLPRHQLPGHTATDDDGGRVHAMRVRVRVALHRHLHGHLHLHRLPPCRLQAASPGAGTSGVRVRHGRSQPWFGPVRVRHLVGISSRHI